MIPFALIIRVVSSIVRLVIRMTQTKPKISKEEETIELTEEIID
jgi:hypothetical protein